MTVFHTTRRIEFADTDMAGIVHFARFFVFMETAEHQLLAALGAPAVHFEHQGREIGWPRVAAACSYRSPVKMGDVLEIAVTVKQRGRRSLTYGFEFSCGERQVASGEISCICCALGGDKLEPVPIPDFLAERLEPAIPAATTS